MQNAAGFFVNEEKNKNKSTAVGSTETEKCSARCSGLCREADACRLDVVKLLEKHLYCIRAAGTVRAAASASGLCASEGSRGDPAAS